MEMNPLRLFAELWLPEHIRTNWAVLNYIH